MEIHFVRSMNSSTKIIKIILRESLIIEFNEHLNILRMKIDCRSNVRFFFMIVYVGSEMCDGLGVIEIAVSMDSAIGRAESSAPRGGKVHTKGCLHDSFG